MPPDRRSGPPVTKPDSRSYDPPAAKQAKSLATLPDGSDRRKLPAELLALSDERDMWLRRVLGAWRDGWAVGQDAGWRHGYAQAEADMAASWRTVTRDTLAIADPRGPEAQASVTRRLTAAALGCRADARAHWHEFTRRAIATPPRLRTDHQRIVACAGCRTTPGALCESCRPTWEAQWLARRRGRSGAA
jgi:hypothetical protein